MRRIEGHLLTPQGGWLRGAVQVDGDRIAAIDGTPVPEAALRDGALPLLLPGFVDLHVHGGGGHDVMDAGPAVEGVARLHARHGTTALLATTMTAPLDEIRIALGAAAPAIARRPAGAARVLGVHLEGPFINPKRLGAQPPFAATATLEAVRALNALAPLRLITLASEVPGHLALIAPLKAAGFIVQLGHSEASYEDGVAALAEGDVGFAHLFNAMSGLHHRAPGLAGAALAHARHAELIPDLLHVHPGAIRAALRSIPCLYCVTDATAAAGMPDGSYRLGRQTVHKCLGGVRLADGTLAGSTLTMDQAFRNLVDGLGLPLAETANRCSTFAADFIGEPLRGRLAVGAHADIVALDPQTLRPRQVWVEGEEIAVAKTSEDSAPLPRAGRAPG